MSLASSEWLNPLEKIAVATAITKREKSVQTKSGKLLLDYDRKPGMIWFKIEGKSVPCGWWSL